MKTQCALKTRYLLIVAFVSAGGAGCKGGDRGALIDGPPVVRDVDAANVVKTVFFTSTAYNGNLMGAGSGTDGLDGGDRLCDARANSAGLTGTFKAWLSTSTVDALDHITGTGPWHNTMNELVFTNHAALQSTPATPVEYDETGTRSAGTPAWTGTNLGGSYASDACNDWTSSAADPDFGQAGSPQTADLSWTEGTDFECTVLRRLYCFQI